jgi:hypothetical protein
MRDFFLNMAPIIWLSNLVLGAMGAVLIYNYKKFKRPADMAFGVLGLLLVIAFVVQSIQIVLKYYYIDGLWLYNIYPPIEYALLCCFLFNRSLKHRAIILRVYGSLFAVIVVGSAFSFGEIPVYTLIIQYTALTALTAHVFVEKPGMVVFGFFLFCAMQTVVISSFVLADWGVPRILQASINLVTNVILIVGVYGWTRGNYYFRSGRNNNTGKYDAVL